MFYVDLIGVFEFLLISIPSQFKTSQVLVQVNICEVLWFLEIREQFKISVTVEILVILREYVVLFQDIAQVLMQIKQSVLLS